MIGCTSTYSGKVPAIIQEELMEGDEAYNLAKYKTDNITYVYHVKRSTGEEVIIQLAEGEGYKDTIHLLVVISVTNNSLAKVMVLEHTETASYGGYVTESWFLDRFIGKKTNKQLVAAKIATKNPEEVSIITGATVTSEAVINAVNSCIENFQMIKEGELQ